MPHCKKHLESKLWTALITPFDNNGAVDIRVFKKLLKQQAIAGSGVVIFGSTGEGLSLTPGEKYAICKAVEEVGAETVMGIPVLVCIPGVNLAGNLELLSMLADFPSICGYLLTTPIYTKPGVSGQTKWFEQLLTKADKSCMLYNIPGRAGVPLHLDTVRNLVGHAGFWAIKESGGDLGRIRQYNEICPQVKVFCGDDHLLPGAARLGRVSGLVSVISNAWPDIMKVYVERCLESGSGGGGIGGDGRGESCPIGRDQEYSNSFNAITRIMEIMAESGSNPLPIKLLMHCLGLIASATVRLPLDLDDVAENFVEKVVELVMNVGKDGSA